MTTVDIVDDAMPLYLRHASGSAGRVRRLVELTIEVGQDLSS